MGNLEFFPFFIILIGLSTVSLAQTSNTATADASLTIITPISIENTTDLNFGNILSPTTAVSVRVRPNGNRSSNDGATFLPSSLGTISAAKFIVTGEPNATFTVTLPSDDTVVLTKTGGIGMKVQLFRRNQQNTRT